MNDAYLSILCARCNKPREWCHECDDFASNCDHEDDDEGPDPSFTYFDEDMD